MKNQLHWTKQAEKQLERIDRRYIPIIINQVSQLIDYPQIRLDVKKLKGKENLYRLRVGNYRVIFAIIDGIPRIILIQTIRKRNERTYNS